MQGSLLSYDKYLLLLHGCCMSKLASITDSCSCYVPIEHFKHVRERPLQCLVLVACEDKAFGSEG